MESNRLRDSIVIITGVVIILGAARYAQEIVVPALLSIFLAIVAAAPVTWLKQRGLPTWAAVSGVLVLFVLMLTLLSTLLGNTVDEFTATLPVYQARAEQIVNSAVAWLAGKGIDVSDSGLTDVLDPAAAMGYANSLVNNLGSVLSNAMLILFTVMFILLEATSFPAKIELMQRSGGPVSVRGFTTIIDDAKRYIGVKTAISLLTGALIWAGTALMGLDYASLWGFIAFVLNFIPTIGSILAAVPAVILSIVQLGPGPTLIIIVMYVAVNTIVGNIIEPAVMGRSVGLSALTVFVSLVFWGWLLGPVGMLLSVPLTMAVKFGLSYGESTRWLAVLLGPEVKPATATTGDTQSEEPADER